MLSLLKVKWQVTIYDTFLEMYWIAEIALHNIGTDPNLIDYYIIIW